MHAFGLSQELCTEFLRKQSVIASLSPGLFAIPEALTIRNLLNFRVTFLEQEKMLRDNVNRMYKETAKWRA